MRVAGEGLLNGVLIEPIVANRAEDPCVSSTAGVLNSQQSVINEDTLKVDLKLLYADTVVQKNSATSEAGVALLRVEVLGHVIEAQILTAEAAASCRSGRAELSSESVVVGLRVDGLEVDVARGQDHDDVVIPLDVGILHLNETIFGSDKITQRALWLDTSLVGDVIVAEAVADFHNNPCGRDPKPPRTARLNDRWRLDLPSQRRACHSWNAARVRAQRRGEQPPSQLAWQRLAPRGGEQFGLQRQPDHQPRTADRELRHHHRERHRPLPGWGNGHCDLEGQRRRRARYQRHP